VCSNVVAVQANRSRDVLFLNLEYKDDCTCSNLQDELSQQNRLVDSLRVELDTAREERNHTQQCYNDKLTEIEGMRKEYDEVKKSCEVKSYISSYLLTVHRSFVD